MGRSTPETDLCEPFGPDTTLYKQHKTVPDLTSFTIDFPDSHIVPDLSMSVSLTHTTFTSQDQLTRSSYTEIVHQDLVSLAGGSTTALNRLVTTLTEWLVILQGVAEDRECDRPNANCRCSKAAKIHQELTLLAKKLINAEQICERVGMIGEEIIEEISDHVHEIANLLRSEVSILIPTSIGRSDPMVVEQARWLVQSSDSRNCASEAVEGVMGLVIRLLGVENCQNCPCKQVHQPVGHVEDEFHLPEDGDVGGGGDEGGGSDVDVDMDILNLVAGLCSGYPTTTSPQHKQQVDPDDLREIGRQTVERSRKRKQALPVRIPSPAINNKSRKVESPTEDPNILTLLEKKKKGVKKDGLYKFVLWREALKDEKSKLSD